jgi:hypothetical protein
MPPSVLIIGQGHGTGIAFWALPQKLAAVYGINVGGMLLQDLTSAAALQPFNAVIVCDLSRKNSDPAVTAQNEYTIAAAKLQALVQILVAYVEQGGGLYVYGHSYSGAGGLAYADTLNELLSQLGAQIPFETIAEQPSLQYQQPDGMQLSYAKAQTIVPHAATQNVASFLYPVGWRTSGYGPWTRPLSLDANWKALIQTSAAAVCTPVDAVGTPTGNASQVLLPATIYASRTLNHGRIILNGSESVISFFNYDFSPYANAQWGTIGMENGLPAQGVGSDGLELLVSSLQWLVEPSVVNSGYGLGGFVPPSPPAPEHVDPVPLWPAPDEVLPVIPYLKGLIAAVPDLGGGVGTIADFVQAAQQEKLSFLVVAGYAAQMTEAKWSKLTNECAAYTDTTPVLPDFPAGFRAIPALLTEDKEGNRFLTSGPPPWPWPSYGAPGVVEDHLAFWFAAHAAFRAPYDISAGHYPPWLFGAYTAFPLRTYQDDKLVEDQTAAWRANLSQGDMCMPFVMTLITDPSQVAAVREHTYVKQADMACFNDHVAASSFVATAAGGPRIDCFYPSASAFRYTAGKLYHPGSERFRVYLRASSTAAVPLSQVTLFDHEEVIRRYAVSGLEVQLNIDLLHDRRHVLTCEVEDVAGGRAVGGGVESQQDLMRQYFLSDRCNMGPGLMATYQASGGPLVRLPATSVLFRGGRLSFNAPVSSDEFLPGVDGSGLSPAFLHSIRFNADVGAANPPYPADGGYPVHRVLRPHESAEAIAFDTPIAKRTATPDPIAHNPAVHLLDPPFQATLRQYYFYRRPATPSTVLADMYMGFAVDHAILVPQAGWRDFRQIYTDFFSTGRFSDYLVVRAVGNAVEQGSPDGNALAWEGLLSPGDFVLFPEVREGFFVLAGNVDARIEGEAGPPKKMSLWTGSKAAEAQFIRLLVAHTTQGGTADEVKADWIALRDAYGLAGPPTGYQLQVLQGTVLSTRYLLSVQMDQWGFRAELTGSPNLPLRLPIETHGVYPLWTAGRVDLVHDEWFPLDVNWEAGYTTIDPDPNGAISFYLGNLVTANDPRVFLTLLPHNDSGKTEVEIHNPKDTAASVEVTVPITSFLAAQQTTDPVMVPAGSSVRIPLV